VSEKKRIIILKNQKSISFFWNEGEREKGVALEYNFCYIEPRRAVFSVVVVVVVVVVVAVTISVVVTSNKIKGRRRAPGLYEIMLGKAGGAVKVPIPCCCFCCCYCRLFMWEVILSVKFLIIEG